MTAKYYINGDGQYLGGFADGAVPPVGSIEVPMRPYPNMRFMDGAWVSDINATRANTRVPRAKVAIAAAKAGLITEAEAEEWAAGAANPQWVSDAIEAAVTDGAIPEEERLEVRIAVRTQDTIGRTSPFWQTVRA